MRDKPPVGGMGGSIDDWERGVDPFARAAMPSEFQHLFPDEPAREGWRAIDWCGNIIGFLPDEEPEDESNKNG